MQSLSEALSYGELTVRSSIDLVVYKFFSMQRHSKRGSSRSLVKVLPDENSFGFCIMRRLFLSAGSGGNAFFIWRLELQHFATGSFRFCTRHRPLTPAASISEKIG